MVSQKVSSVVYSQPDKCNISLKKQYNIWVGMFLANNLFGASRILWFPE
ncbi:hypothetical protein [Calothrix sp. NIES-2098]